MSSAGGHEYGYDGEPGPYDPQYGAHGAGHDGYGPPAYSDHQGAAGGYGDNYTSYSDSGPRRHASAAALDDYYRRGGGGSSGEWGEPGAERTGHGHDLARRNRPMQRGRMYEYDDDSSDDEYDRRGRGKRDRSRSRGDDKDKRGRSLSAFGKRLSSYFGPEEHNDGKDNNDTKKWGATLAGALAGGLVGRMANKNTVAPAALGAFIGGFTAREAEKKYYRRRELKEKEHRRELKYGAE